VSAILKALGFGVQPAKPEMLQNECVLNVQVPGFRQQDVRQEADLIEEVLRIEGYNNVPATLPALTLAPTVSKRQHAIRRLHQFWQGVGLQEVSTASLVGPEAMSALGFALEQATTVGLINSHSQEHTCLRQALLPSLLQVAQHNLSVGQAAVWVYEVGKAYFKRGKASHKQTGVHESLRLSVLLTGQPTAPSWRKALPLDALTLKGLMEGLLQHLNLHGRIQLQQASANAAGSLGAEVSYSFLHPGQQAQLLWLPTESSSAKVTNALNASVTGKRLGWLGQVHPSVLHGKSWKHPVFALELELEPLLKACSQPVSLHQLAHAPLNLYPALERDLAFVVPDGVSYGALETALLATEDERVKQVTLFDEYCPAPPKFGGALYLSV
jgi:phenylalanyl-tRNA synthetase beta chain